MGSERAETSRLDWTEMGSAWELHSGALAGKVNACTAERGSVFISAAAPARVVIFISGPGGYEVFSRMYYGLELVGGDPCIFMEGGHQLLTQVHP